MFVIGLALLLVLYHGELETFRITVFSTLRYDTGTYGKRLKRRILLPAQ